MKLTFYSAVIVVLLPTLAFAEERIDLVCSG